MACCCIGNGWNKQPESTILIIPPVVEEKSTKNTLLLILEAQSPVDHNVLFLPLSNEVLSRMPATSPDGPTKFPKLKAKGSPGQVPKSRVYVLKDCKPVHIVYDMCIKDEVGRFLYLIIRYHFLSKICGIV